MSEMNDLTRLYQEVLLDHYRSPRHFGRLAEPTGRAEGHNPLCGDRIAVEARLADGHLAEVAFEGAGCAISTASASLMTEAVSGLSPAEIEELFERFRKAVTGDPAADVEALGKLGVLSGVKEFPMRVKCATLGWHTLLAALGSGGTVSTE